MVLPSPKAWHSTSSSTIAAMADNRNSQLPSIWRQRMTGLPLPSVTVTLNVAVAGLLLAGVANALYLMALRRSLELRLSQVHDRLESRINS